MTLDEHQRYVAAEYRSLRRVLSSAFSPLDVIEMIIKTCELCASTRGDSASRDEWRARADVARRARWGMRLSPYMLGLPVLTQPSSAFDCDDDAAIMIGQRP